MHLPLWLRAGLAAALLAGGLPVSAADVAVPALRARVTDVTGTLPPPVVAELEQRLAAFEKEKGAQVAVLMVASTQPESIEEYAVRAFEQWKLGRKGIDDGVLLVIAKNDRKLRIEVGYGLEGALNDATAKRIISETIVPRFKQGDFAGGVSAGVARILGVVSGEALPPPAAGPPGGSSLPWFDPVWLVTAAILVHVVSRVLRAVVGRLPAAGIMSLFFGGGVWLVFGSLIAAIIVSVIAFVVALVEGVPRGAIGSGGWSGGGGSWSSGGGGGGFSGGGGSSGGGGASGSW